MPSTSALSAARVVSEVSPSCEVTTSERACCNWVLICCSVESIVFSRLVANSPLDVYWFVAESSARSCMDTAVPCGSSLGRLIRLPLEAWAAYFCTFVSDVWMPASVVFVKDIWVTRISAPSRSGSAACRRSP